jgi:hypothetical protein
MNTPIIARSFRHCTMSERLLYSVFLLLVGMGYIAALTLVYLTHEGLDGKHGIDMRDIAISYYGNRSGTTMEEMLRGPMRVHSKPRDTAQLVAWLQSGASRRGYQAVARPILKKDCFECHSGATAKNLHVPDFSTFGGVRSVTTVNPGASILSLVKLSHIHLFGIGLLLFATGWIFRFAVLNRWLKWTLIVVPFLAIFADILAWFLTKWDPTYAYVVVIGGALMGCAWGAQILISLYQLWFLHGPEKPVEPR